MPLPRKPSAVVFDMDGLLFDTEVLYRAATTAAAIEMGHHMPDSVFGNLIGLPPGMGESVLLDHFGADFDVTGLWRLADARFRVSVADGPPLKAGVLELLGHLDEAGMPRAIATSSKHTAVEHHLGALGLKPRFPVVVAHGDYARGKPNPDPFLMAAARLGIAPEDCLALEDSHNGVRAASSAGMMTIMVPDLLEATAEMQSLCVRIARDLHEVHGVLKAA